MLSNRLSALKASAPALSVQPVQNAVPQAQPASPETSSDAAESTEPQSEVQCHDEDADVIEVRVVQTEASRGEFMYPALEDESVVQRLWKNTLGNLSKTEMPRWALIKDAKATWDADQKMLNIEFKQENEFAYQTCNTQEIRNKIARSMAASIGYEVPFELTWEGDSKTTSRAQSPARPIPNAKPTPPNRPGPAKKITPSIPDNPVNPKKAPQKKPNPEQPPTQQAKHEKVLSDATIAEASPSEPKFQAVEEPVSVQAPAAPVDELPPFDEPYYEDVPVDLYEGDAAYDVADYETEIVDLPPVVDSPKDAGMPAKEAPVTPMPDKPAVTGMEKSSVQEYNRVLQSVFGTGTIFTEEKEVM
ncbi:MAG: hypothetical protein LUB61_07815 [Eggerthellaceae bacterium]|nr:hypothetical protein [Eggerthellaceae bacterium]